MVQRLIQKFRAWVLTQRFAKINGGRIVVAHAFLPIRITVEERARLVIRKQLTFEGFQGSRAPVWITLREGATMVVDGDFSLGPGCRIYVGRGAVLHIGGRKSESGSGITENGRIMVRKSVRIGSDFICAWGIFITDCDWHQIEGQPVQEDTIIGNHVWVAPNCSILKGSQIGDGCIISTGSVVHRTTLPNNVLVGGIPGRVLATDRKWSRDLKTPEL